MRRSTRIIEGGAPTRRGEPETGSRVVVKFRDGIGLPYDDNVARNLEERRIGPWLRLTGRFPGISIRRLFNSIEPERIQQLVTQAKKRNEAYRPPDFLAYFVVDIPAGVEFEELVRELSSWGSVQAAYFAPPGEEPGGVSASDSSLRTSSHLDAAPEGIDARFAWDFEGGDGAGQQLVDLERGWTLEHLDIKGQGATQMCGANIESARPHGTSVLGVICAEHKRDGGLGIAPKVGSVKVISHYGECNGQPTSVANAIVHVVDSLPVDSGAVLLLEVQHFGLPAEYLMDVFHAIQLAVEHGVTVVEAAGNGGMNGVDFDGLAVANQGPILRRGLRDSGAIVVAAAKSKVDPASYKHARENTSNYGSRIDCYAWGENVAAATSTTSTPFSDNDYRNDFDGTSSAAAIIAGAALLVQAMAKASGHSQLSPSEMRELLRDKTLGTESDDPNNFPIGVMPNLRRIIKSGKIGVVPLKSVPGQ